MYNATTHYEEGDWINHTYKGDEFGFHYLYLGYHTKINCIYCQDVEKHGKSECDEHCTCCKDEQNNFR